MQAMADKFILKRKKSAYSTRNSRYMTVRIRTSDYNLLAGWATETGKPLVSVLSDCLRFAEEHLEWQEN